ncbi:Gfo/Idh/MocA family oxidoreductase [Olsenella phocaeensis]|uniref:Gfo/Idh/MocA family oxidoreductase n=1 Tax=Olsenella phocaeensis TaxID=1852385 RepID=UPI0009300449|nr:Gfo/Idh/MocA family oxidoreductase [Olsenella phocaeensis]
MTKVITYGTFDLLHHGHVRLLERARSLGDYLVVAVTTDDFDIARGKINVQQSLAERMESVRETGLADEIIVEEYEGQKIDDIQRLCIDVFAVGSDWVGQFDYLKEYCDVVYLDRTEGISSTQIRSEKKRMRLGLVGDVSFLTKYLSESEYVNGLDVSGICARHPERLQGPLRDLGVVTGSLDELLASVDAIYIASTPSEHFEQIKQALERGIHVLCESPIALDLNDFEELEAIAHKADVRLVEAIRPAYSTAFKRLCLLVKSGVIGKVTSVDATCTSLIEGIGSSPEIPAGVWGSMEEWGPIAMLPVFQMLGTDFSDLHMVSRRFETSRKLDAFTKADFVFPDAVASIIVGKGVKSEGDLVVSGTRGYAYVPAPWWRTDYFELRFENPANNRRYFYQLDGAGIRNQLASFVRMAESGTRTRYIDPETSRAIVRVMSDFVDGRNVTQIA